MMYDVAVVGGGPVGLVAAIEARLAGLSVVVLEQRAGAVDKACGEALMPGAIPLLRRLGVDPDGFPLRGVTYQQGHRSVTHRFVGDAGRGVRRLELHGSLLARASELGVVTKTARVREIRMSPASVSPSAGVEARYLLACDGLHSPVARLVGLSLPVASEGRRYGVRQHFSVRPWSDNIEVYYGATAELYVTPITNDRVGVAMLASRGVDFSAAIGSVPALASRLSTATVASDRRGAGPFGQRTSARTAGRILLVGDASGYVDAITGEGLRLGFAQATAAVDAIVAGHPEGYEQSWVRATRDFRYLTRGLVLAANSPLRRGIVPLAVALPRLFGSVVERLAR